MIMIISGKILLQDAKIHGFQARRLPIKENAAHRCVVSLGFQVLRLF